MILQYVEKLNLKKIILASSSPRRKEILEKIGLTFTVIPSNFEEILDPKTFENPEQFVLATAQGKLEEVLSRYKNSDLIIAADTCVAIDSEIFGKPKNKEDATKMLFRLSNKMHKVITGVKAKWRECNDSASVWHSFSFAETTLVHFADLNEALVECYVKSGEPMDKAGGYGIQGIGGCLIKGIEGDYYNVMGFPLHAFTQALIPPLENWSIESTSFATS